MLEHPPEVSIVDGGDNNSDHCTHGVLLHSTFSNAHANQLAEKAKVVECTSYDWSEDNINVYYGEICAVLLHL